MRFQPNKRYLLQSAALASFAVSGPLLNLLGQNGTFFVAHGMRDWSIVWFALIIGFVPALVAVIIELFFALFGWVGKYAHYLFSAALFSVIFSPMLKRFAMVPRTELAVIILAGLVAGYLTRKNAISRIVAISSIAILVFPIIFLFFSPVKMLLTHVEIGSSGAKIDKDFPVFLIVFDEMNTIALLDKDKNIDRKIYPNFAKLADDSIWFRKATSIASTTEVAVPAILTGIRPKSLVPPFELPVLENYPDNLFTFFKGQYEVKGFERATSLCPQDQCSSTLTAGLSKREKLIDTGVIYFNTVLPGLFADRAINIDGGWSGFGEFRRSAIDTRNYGDGEDVRFRNFVASIDGRKDTFYFGHFFLPHVPYRFLPNGEIYNFDTLLPDGVDMSSGRWANNEKLVSQGYQRYLLQAQFADKLLGEFIQKLKYEKIYEKSLIIITADHGVSFLAGEPRRNITSMTAPEILPIPLLVKEPNQAEGNIDDRFVSSLDIVPTIVELLSAQKPYDMSSCSLFESCERLHAFPADEKLQKEAMNFAALDKKLELFTYGEDAFPELRKQHELVGQRVDYDLPMCGGSFLLGNSSLFENVNTLSQFLPVLVTGSLTARTNSNLVISLNGVITSSAAVFEKDRTQNLQAMSPERFFQNGKNIVSAYELDSKGKPMCELKTVIGSPLSGVGGTVLFRESTSVKTPASDALYNIESVREKLGVFVSINGWIAVPKGSTKVNRVIFSCGNFGDVSATLLPRIDVDNYFKGTRDAVGFNLVLLDDRMKQVDMNDCQLSFSRERIRKSRMAIPENKRCLLASIGAVDRTSSVRSEDNLIELSNGGGGSSSLKGVFVVDEASYNVERVSIDGGCLKISGWATNLEHSRAIDNIYILLNDDVIYSHVPNVSRDDVSRHFSVNNVENNGFDFVLSLKKEIDIKDIKIIGRIGKKTFMISY
ncbi:MAG: sulfatase-like hydrolase/transferase [bacterium]